jgi:CelD/BcsL family acetyltransferase involved in cellulose biosynthesis
MHGHLCGFDPNYSKYSVGNLLLWKVLEECVEKGISEYDFMQGNESYKFNWTDKQRQNMNVRFVNKKISSKLISLAIAALGMLKFYVRKVIPDSHLASAAANVIGKVFRLQ